VLTPSGKVLNPFGEGVDSFGEGVDSFGEGVDSLGEGVGPFSEVVEQHCSLPAGRRIEGGERHRLRVNGTVMAAGAVAARVAVLEAEAAVSLWGGCDPTPARGSYLPQTGTRRRDVINVVRRVHDRAIT